MLNTYDNHKMSKILANRRVRYLMNFCGFLDLLGVSMLIPVLTREARKYNASPFAIGLFGSLYGFLQLFSGPLIGLVSDHVGRGRTLVICLIGASIGYFLLGISDSFFFMVIYRIPSGIFKHSQTLARAYLVDITPGEERSAVFGTFNSVASLGFIFGPLIGGHLVTTKNGFSTIAFLTCVSCWLNALLISAFLYVSKAPTTSDAVTRDKRTSLPKSIKAKSNPSDVLDSLHRICYSLVDDFRRLPWNRIADIFTIRFLSSLAVILFRTNFATILEFRYNTTPQTVGYIISFNSIITALSGFSVGWITKTFKNVVYVHNFFLLTSSISLACIAFAPSVFFIVVFLVPLCMSTAVLRACSSVIVYRKASDQEVGLLTGLSNSILSISRMMAPAIGGLLQEFSFYGPGIAASALAGVAFVASLYSDLGYAPDKTEKIE